MIEVMLVTKQEAVLRALRQLLSGDEELEIIAEAVGGDSALEKVESRSPDILLINSGEGDTDALSIAERVILRKPRTFVILLQQSVTVDTLQAATAVGCHNVIPFPTDGKEFCSYIHRVYNAEHGRITALTTNERVTWASKVLTVYGAKGGLGKTTIAVNLAIRLAEENKKVAIVDLDLQFGDVNIFMDIEPKDTIAELMQDMDNPTIDIVRSYMTIHSSGVHVLCAPKSPEYADMISGEQIQTLLNLLRANYDYVVVDTGANFDDTTLAALEVSTTILFITGLDVSILKNSKVALNVLESLGMKKNVRTIINRAVEVNTITIADVERIVDTPIISRIPSDYIVAAAALNQGQPFSQMLPRSRLSLAIADLANNLITGINTMNLAKLPKKERRAMMKENKKRLKQSKKQPKR